MVTEELVRCFEDTLEYSKSSLLEKETINARKNSMVYKEGFESKKRKSLYKKTANKVSAGVVFCVNPTKTFDEARQHLKIGKVAVLNFAHPEHPGGGVFDGAQTQEECLCRSSNLYLCLSDAKNLNDFYTYHRNLNSPIYTDRLIYTKDITVFKTDDELPHMMDKKDFFYVDVITCGAPCIANINIDTKELKQIFKKRIKNIFEVAIENNVDILVLGAFGCGAFRNPPRIVAKAFKETIEENLYNTEFKQIVFAIKPTTDKASDCPNYTAFHKEFGASVKSKIEDFVPSAAQATQQLFTDKICLSVQGQDELFEKQKPEIKVGRQGNCDLWFEPSYTYISGHHATFIFEDGVWSIVDENSTNGVWIDGERITPGKKYFLFESTKILLANKLEIEFIVVSE